MPSDPWQRGRCLLSWYWSSSWQVLTNFQKTKIRIFSAQILCLKTILRFNSNDNLCISIFYHFWPFFSPTVCSSFKKLNRSCTLNKKFLFLKKKVVSLKKTSFEILWSEVWKGGFQLMLILGLLGTYVLWCCGGICHQVLTFVQIGCGHTVTFKENGREVEREINCFIYC